MLVAVIQVSSYEKAKAQIVKALAHAQALELRLDYSQRDVLALTKKLRDEFVIPMIFTLRTQSQGGFYAGSEAERLQEILALCLLNPEFLDIEYTVPDSFLEVLRDKFPAIKLICSYHNFSETPDDLKKIFLSLQKKYFDFYKIVTHANSTLDSLRMLRFVDAHARNNSLTGICMGELGQCTRLIAAVVGSAMNYISVDASTATAKGQLTLDDVTQIYFLQNTNTSTKIYALLGDPVNLSAGHLVHNQAIQILQKNALYLKFQVTQNELAETLARCRQLPFYGFSVTMPHKESILSFVDSTCSSVNTLIKKLDSFVGFSTDGLGAVKALQRKCEITSQRIIVLGAGGAARAICDELKKLGAEIIVINRSLNKALQLADEAYDFDSAPSLKSLQYTCIINTLPICAYANISLNQLLHKNNLLPQTCGMEIVYNPIVTPFIKRMRAANCDMVYGYEMFIQQALLQICRWFNPTDEELKTIETHMLSFFAALHNNARNLESSTLELS